MASMYILAIYINVKKVKVFSTLFLVYMYKFNTAVVVRFTTWDTGLVGYYPK